MAWFSDPSICYDSLPSDSRPSPDRDSMADLAPDSAVLLSWSQETIYEYAHSFLYPWFWIKYVLRLYVYFDHGVFSFCISGLVRQSLRTSGPLPSPCASYAAIIMFPLFILATRPGDVPYLRSIIIQIPRAFWHEKLPATEHYIGLRSSEGFCLEDLHQTACEYTCGVERI